MQSLKFWDQWFILILGCWVFAPGETRRISSPIVESLGDPALNSSAKLSETNSGNLDGSQSGKNEEQFYIYYPLGIINGSLTVIGNPILYKASEIVGHPHWRTKRQIGLNTADAALGGILGGAFGGLIGGTIYAPLGPLGSAFGGGLGAGIGSAVGAGFGGGGPGAFLLGGAAGATGGTIGGLLLGPTGSLVLGLLGGGVGGALGSIG